MFRIVALPLVAVQLAVAGAQQVYISTNGPSARPQCTAAANASTPTYAFSEFSFTQTETMRYAISVPPRTSTTTYAPAYSEVSTLLSSVSTTSWGSWNPNATTTPSDSNNPYGQAAWTQAWHTASLANFTYSSRFSSTVSPTPIPSSELILPPQDYFGPTDCYSFPEGFMFGVAGSAAQIEGAVNQEGKTPTLLDVRNRPGSPADYVTNENYFYYKQDIERLAAMGVEYYSFSISWTRILPFALPGTPVNSLGLKHYDDVIDFVLEKGMKPVVTLLHFDSPLQFYYGNLSAVNKPAVLGYSNGAYQNSTFVDAFVNYGKIVMAHYADRVPVWFTFNEPLLYCDNGAAVDHVLRAHSQVAHFYKDKLNGTGMISMKLNDNFGVPLDPTNNSHVNMANHFNSLQLGTFGNPIFLGMDYPESFKMTITDYVPLTQEDLEYMNGTADFFGVDPYTATVVAPPSYGIAACAANQSDPFFPYCANQTTVNAFGWDIGYRSQSYVYITPTYLRTYLSYLYNTFRHPVVITEFGFPVFAESEKDLVDQLFDTPRSLYYLSYMSEVLKAIWEDGVNVMGAFAWSFADNWEFGDYDQHFGIQTVNRTTQERRYKKSFFDLVDFVKTRQAR